jgi:hypothetical protein
VILRTARGVVGSNVSGAGYGLRRQKSPRARKVNIACGNLRQWPHRYSALFTSLTLLILSIDGYPRLIQSFNLPHFCPALFILLRPLISTSTSGCKGRLASIEHESASLPTTKDLTKNNIASSEIAHRISACCRLRQALISVHGSTSSASSAWQQSAER